MKVCLFQPIVDPLNTGLWPPVGLCYLATTLRTDGHEVVILDDLRDCGTRIEEFARKLLEIKPELVGFTLYTKSIPRVRELVSTVRSNLPLAKIVLGGPHVSALPDQVLNNVPESDFAIRGEGEVPLRSLVRELGGAKAFSNVPGLIYRDGSGMAMNQPYFAANVEDYGVPSWDLIDPRSYLVPGENTPFPVFCSRGCPFPCTFCAAKVTSGQNLRKRSMDHIFAELHQLQDRYGMDRFVVYDEGFGTSKKFMMEFCERVVAENFKAVFHSGTGIRLDQVDEELLRALDRAHFFKLIPLGIESGSERILKLMKKKSDLNLIREKVRLMDRMGFDPTGFFILGYPSETREEMEMTIQLALELPLREASFTPFQPLPATEATRMLMDSGELPRDFDYGKIVSGAITYAPQGMTTTELQAIRRRAIRRFYLRPHILMRMARSKRMVRYMLGRFVSIFLKDRAA